MLVLVSAINFGQELPRLSPPTPEVAAMGKFIDIPVSLHTGTPNISIPLMSISEQGIDVPVSINYHSSGIKVNEIASRVGLGWALNAGGMITRQVRGIADDNQEGFLSTSNTVAAFYSLTSQQRVDQIVSASRGSQDYESDIYYFNYPGGSGKFHFDQSGNIYVHPKSDLKITFTRDTANNFIDGWQITTPNGTMYTFGKTLESLEVKDTRIHVQNQQLPTGANSYTSGWHLTKIRDYRGNVIRFNYSKGAEDIRYWNVLDQKKYFHADQIIGGGACPVPQPNVTLSEDVYKPIFLTSIEGTQGSIYFSYDSPRIDLKNDNALTKIELKDASNTLIDSYAFEHGYFITSPWEQLGNHGNIDQRTKKLYLKTITQQKGNTTNKKHSFSYHQDKTFPERFSFNQDFWGYANGADNNVLYPGIVYRNAHGNPREIDGGDRTIDVVHAQTLLLKEITYPTKGSTTLMYESNTLSGESESFLGNKLEEQAIPEASLQMADVLNSPNRLTTNFTLAESTTVYAQTHAQTPCPSNYNDCPNIKLYKANGDLVFSFQTDNTTEALQLAAGDYTVEMVYLIPSNNYIEISFYKKVLVNTTANGNVEALTGGLRIKEMNFKDTNGSIVNTKKYNYQHFNDNTVSSGRSLSPPTILQKGFPVYVESAPDCYFNIIQSSSSFPLNGQSSNHVGYLNVTEYNTDETQGKIEYSYSFAPDGASGPDEINNSGVFDFDLYSFPYPPGLDYAHRRGILINQKTYRYNKTTLDFTLVEESSNRYKKYGEVRIDNIIMGYPAQYPRYAKYHNISEGYLLSSTRKTNYYPSGEIKTNTQYHYDTGYTGRSIPIETTIVDSHRDTITTKTYYPDDVTSTTALGEALTAAEYSTISNLKKNATQHRIGVPIQEETRINGELTSIQRTNYKDWSGITLPEVIQAVKGGGTLQNRIEYLDYDVKGNPLEVKKTDGSHMLYIWGYENSYPIAKIDNASYTDMPAAVITLINQIKSNTNQETTTTEEVTIRGLFDDLRAHEYFTNAQITSFTYDPLLGVTSVTDPRGYTMYYEYDTFNRLEYVKDDAGKLISENKYGYKN